MGKQLWQFWPIGLFLAGLSLCLLLWAKIDDGAATLVAGFLTSASTAFVGWVAYRGLVVPITVQRDADRSAIAHLLIADLMRISDQVLDVRADIDVANEVDPPRPFLIAFDATDERFQSLGLKVGIFPVHTVLAVCQAYALIPGPVRVKRWANMVADPNHAGLRAKALDTVSERFTELDEAITKANAALAAYIRHD